MVIKFLEHTGDVAYEVEASTLEDMLEEAVKGMYKTFIDIEQIIPRVQKKVEVKAPQGDYNRLLFLLLNEFIYLLDTENFIFKRFKTKKIKKTKESEELVFEGIAEGDSLGEQYHVNGAGVKAPTYHNMKVVEEGGKWKARIVLDI